MVFGLLGSLAARPTGDPTDLPNWSCGFDSRRPLPCSGPGRAHGRGTSPEPEPGRGPHTGHMSRIACVLGLTLAGLAGQAAECFGDHLITITGGVFWRSQILQPSECSSGGAGFGAFVDVRRSALASAVVGGVGSPVSGGGSLPGDSDADVDAEQSCQQGCGEFGGEAEQCGRDASAIRIRDRRGTRPCAVRHEISGCETSRRIRCRSTPPTPANGHRSATLEAEQPPAVHPMAGGVRRAGRTRPATWLIPRNVLSVL